MILAVLLAAQISAILAVPMQHGRLAVSLASVTGLAMLQIRHFRRGPPRPLWLRLGVLAAEGLATYLPLLAADAAWPGMGGFLAASALLVTRGWAAWALFTAVMVGLFAAITTLGPGLQNADSITVASLAVGVIIFGVDRLIAVIKQVHGMHAEAVPLAVIRERLRFAGDLHDLLGYNLAAITLRAELTRRLVGNDPASASEELREVVDIARRAAAEVRQVADGYRNISLPREVAAAASLLASASIDAHVGMNCGILPDKIDNVLALVLRELITNVLRHSSARNCWITVEQADQHVTLSVANDGVPRAAAAHRDGGGLENLALRLDAVDGILSATAHGDGRFSVHAVIANDADAGVRARQHRTGRTLS